MAVLKVFGADVLAANVAKRQAIHDVRLGISKMDMGEPVTPGKQSKSKRRQKQSDKESDKVPDKVIEVSEDDSDKDGSAKDIDVDKDPSPGKAE